jgi:plasmid stability protein
MTTARAIRVPDDLWHAALVRASEHGDTVSAIVRASLETYVRANHDKNDEIHSS